MKKDKKVSIITINYNQSKMTLECADSVLKSTYVNYRLIIVDNGSNKDEFDVLKDNIDSKVIIERIENNCGYVGGVNRGLEIGQSFNPDYFLIMNNDTVIDKDAVKYLVEASEKYNDGAIISGKVYHFDKPEVFQYLGGLYKDKKYLIMDNIYEDEVDSGQCDKEAERDMLDDIFWLLPTKVYNEVGNYSNNYFLYAEQADYALQAVKKGFKLIYTPKAKLWHKGSITTGDGKRYSAPVNFWRNKSWVIYLNRNTERKYFWIKILNVFAKASVKNLLNLIHLRKPDDKESEYAALIGYIYGLKWVFNQKPDNGYNPFIK